MSVEIFPYQTVLFLEFPDVVDSEPNMWMTLDRFKKGPIYRLSLFEESRDGTKDWIVDS